MATHSNYYQTMSLPFIRVTHKHGQAREVCLGTVFEARRFFVNTCHFFRNVADCQISYIRYDSTGKITFRRDVQL